MSTGRTVAILKNFRRYQFTHMICGLIDEDNLRQHGKAWLEFLDGTAVTVQEEDVILTSIPADAIPAQ